LIDSAKAKPKLQSNSGIPERDYMSHTWQVWVRERKRKKVRLVVPVTAGPHFHIFDHPAEDVSRRGVFVVEDLGVPCFPNLPKHKEHHINTYTIREVSSKAKQPGLTEISVSSLSVMQCKFVTNMINISTY
jgi:hypothetical protein